MRGANVTHFLCIKSRVTIQKQALRSDTSLLDGSNHFGDVFFYLKDIMMLAAHWITTGQRQTLTVSQEQYIGRLGLLSALIAHLLSTTFSRGVRTIKFYAGHI